MITIKKQEETKDNLLEQFGIKPEKSSEIIKNKHLIYNNDKEIGYLVLSEDEFSHMEFENEFGDDKKFIYLSFIEMHESGFLRETFNQLKNILAMEYDYLILHVDFYHKDKYDRLVQIYEHLGFKELFPATLHDFFSSENELYDLSNDPFFMFLNLKN